ncbi:MAG: hypothetical protein ABIQ73_01275 [Acidimicrobiales bacterium]
MQASFGSLDTSMQVGNSHVNRLLHAFGRDVRSYWSAIDIDDHFHRTAPLVRWISFVYEPDVDSPNRFTNQRCEVAELLSRGLASRISDLALRGNIDRNIITQRAHGTPPGSGHQQPLDSQFMVIEPDACAGGYGPWSHS